MIFYSIYDTSFVFGDRGIDGLSTNTNFCEMNVDGVMVQVSRTNNSELRIERILSTNPKDFLNPKLQPGSTVQYNP
ncbi:YlzJ-like family protein [Ruminiclostridium herbifermentans]|uniref:YlzJ-like family protein n=1 Tax=Ruminiclostridium herbifermentans TaxID=2488810 RepID=A0A4U7JMN1_9FIRM|nr:YlzJ-like family protein [Ruminiclostridium herbifermentans]QNU65295.1 YlzJ-like family protein [Ruminiclostridium herbifermentans]